LPEGQEDTDSKDVYGVVQTFRKIWTEQGLVKIKRKELVHGELVKQILESISLPWVLVAHACNPATQEVEIRRLTVQSQTQANSS
jgi:hypothetical protein